MNRLAIAMLTAALALPAAAQYKVLSNTKVGGEGGWDYVTADSVGRRLYIARSGPAGHVTVFDLDTLAPAGDIPNASGHGAVVDSKYNHGFIASKPVQMFDSKTLKVIKTLDTQGNPDGYLVDPSDDHVYILSHSEPNVTIIDAKDGAILGTVNIGGAPEQGQVDGKGHLFVDIEDKDAIAVIDTKTMKMTGKYDIHSHGGGCAGLALDKKNDILFASCRDKNNMIILSAKDGKIITDLPTGKGSDGMVFNPETMEAFSSQGDGTLTIVKENSPTSFVVEQTVATPQRARTLTLDTKTNKVILVTAEFGPAPAPATPPTPGQRPGRAPMLPGSFSIVTVGK